ncbi:TonB-dependent receptor [candidate division KSB1 bacterium]|nr:TonB-dependent receptor [candidate division KSB1 bacterium]
MKLKGIFLIGLFLLLSSQFLFAGTIHGFVREKATREPILMGNVWIKGTTIGTTTNMKGFYVLSSLKPGTYEVYFRYIGYKTEVVKITMKDGEDLTRDVYLELEPIAMQEAVVTAERDKRELDIKPSQIAVQASQLRTIPQVAEPDLFRALQMLPGVATLSDFSAGLYVRGGSPDQNLILLDQIDVYNPNHMFGFFSSFNTDAVKSVELLKGGFPAMYGGRLSSVLNVINKEGNREQFEGVTRISLLSSTATLEGPWKYGSWMVSGRRTYLDLASKIVDFDLPYYFYDGHARINFDIDKNNQASLSLYLGNDKLNMEQGGTDILLDWGNKTFSAQWTHLFSSKFFSHFVVAGSRFDSDSKIRFDEYDFGISNNISDLAVKGSLTYTPNMNHSMDFGFEGKKLDFNLNYLVVNLKYPNSFKGQYYALYLQDNYRLGTFDILQTGLRLEHYTDGSYTKLTPRLSLKHLLSDQMNLTLSYGRFAQFLNQVQQEGMSFADMWFPVDKTFEPGQADHYILGWNFDNQKTFSINAEAYYKNYLNVAEFRDFESRGGDEDWSKLNAAMNFYKARAYSYGGDIYLRNNFRGFEGWIGYSYNLVRKKVNGYNFDKEYYPTYDRRHTITAIQDYWFPGRKWRFNFAFRFGTGQPYTESTGIYTGMNPSGTTYVTTLEGEKNIYRLPAYHRLDAGVFYLTRWFGLDTELYLQMINLYNNKNVWFRYYEYENGRATRKDFNMLPFLPTAGISFKF